MPASVRPATVAGLVLLLCGPLGGAGQAEEPPAPVADESARFAGPLIAASFLNRIIEEAQVRLLEQERRTKVWVDPKTRLMWTAADNGKDVDWERAVRYCEELELAGYDDWTLPTIEQLESLHHPMTQKPPFHTPPGVLLSACCPWSSTKRAETTAWNFSFRFRKRFSGSLTYSFDLRALCARPASDEDLERAKELAKARALALP